MKMRTMKFDLRVRMSKRREDCGKRERDDGERENFVVSGS